MMRIRMLPSRQLILYAVNHSTLLESDLTQLAQLTISDISQSYTSNLLGYRPRFNDYHGSGLGAIFINIEGVFPCVAPLASYYPICSTFTEEGDGFRNGIAIIDSADIGNHFRIFSTSVDIVTYGIAFQQCPELNTTCFPTYHSFITPAISQEQPVLRLPHSGRIWRFANLMD